VTVIPPPENSAEIEKPKTKKEQREVMEPLRYEDGTILNISEAEEVQNRAALNKTGRNRARAAKLVGLARSTFLKKLRLYGITDAKDSWKKKK